MLWDPQHIFMLALLALRVALMLYSRKHSLSFLLLLHSTAAQPLSALEQRPDPDALLERLNPRAFNDVRRAARGQLSVHVGGRELLLEQDASFGISGVVYDSSLVLAQLLLSHATGVVALQTNDEERPPPVQGLRVLELGCGCGACRG